MAFSALFIPAVYAGAHLGNRGVDLFTAEWFGPAVAASLFSITIGALAGFFYHNPPIPRFVLLPAAAILAIAPVAFLKDPTGYVIAALIVGAGFGDRLAKAATPQTNPPTPDHSTPSPE